MNFCPNCGSKLNPGVKFCGECGFSVSGNVSTNDSKSNSSFEAPVQNKTCPFCGSPVSSFSPVCAGCGKEISDISYASECQKLSARLDQIEASRPQETLLSTITGFIDKAMQKTRLKPTDQQFCYSK